MTKGITMATAKAVAAGNSCRQEDVIATANLSRRAIADMLRACKVEVLGGEVGRLQGFGRPETLKLTCCSGDRKQLSTQKWRLMCGSEPCTMAGSVPMVTWSCWTTCCW